MKNFVQFFALSFMFTALLIGCKRDNGPDAGEANQAAEEQALNDDVAEDLSFTADDGIERFGQFGPGPFRTCATLTSTAPIGTFPNTITIDFGPNGCPGPGGRMHTGQLQINLSGAMNTAGATRTLTPVNLLVDSIAVSGTHVLTYNGPNSSGQPVWSISATQTLTFPNGSSSTWSSTRTRTMVAGFGTPLLRSDDVFEITGSGRGVNRNGTSYTTTIVSPLRIEAGCRWIVSGVITVTAPAGTRSLDYGAGTCDRIAVVTLPSGATRNILLRR